MPALTLRPWSSTGTATRRLPAKAKTSREKRYPGSSIQTGLPGSTSTCAEISRACWDPETIKIWSASQVTDRAVRKYDAMLSRSGRYPIWSPYPNDRTLMFFERPATMLDHVCRGKLSAATWPTPNAPQFRVHGIARYDGRVVVRCATFREPSWEVARPFLSGEPVEVKRSGSWLDTAVPEPIRAVR